MSGVTTNTLMLAVLLSVSIVSASADEPKRIDDKPQVDAPAASEAEAKCPCADHFAKAVAAYDARPGIPERPQWKVCSIPRGSVGKYGAGMKKFDALTPAHEGRTTTIILQAHRKRTVWGARSVECFAFVTIDTPVVKDIIPMVIQGNLSDAELAACETAIRAIAKCPEQIKTD